jgi:beta-mannanase
MTPCSVGGKGVKNTIWLLALDGSAKSAFFPGAQYVDIGGADNYLKAYDYSPMTVIFNNTVKIFPMGMPIALHECGPVPDPDLLQSSNTRWLMFNIWTNPYPQGYSTVAQLQKVYTSSYVVTRDEMPDLR